MNRRIMQVSTASVPRRRGDEPWASARASLRSVPRRRGDEPLYDWRRSAIAVFPAGAGMNRGSSMRD